VTDRLAEPHRRRAPEFDREDVRALAVREGLADTAEQLAALARWAMRIEPADEPPEAGGSKIGGRPDLPRGLGWPASRPMRSVFVAQIAVGDMPVDPCVRFDLLRDTSLISFFAFQDAVEREVLGGRVVVAPAGVALERAAPSGWLEEVIEPERAVTLRAELTLPPWAAHPLPLRLTGRDRDAYDRLVVAVEHAQRSGPPRDRLLGHPDRIRHDVLEEAVVLEAWAGGANEPSPETIAARAEGWRLLLRIDSDPRRGIRWPGGGTLYFCILASGLRQGRYELARAFTHAPGPL
jgi:hypothetical protein